MASRRCGPPERRIQLDAPFRPDGGPRCARLRPVSPSGDYLKVAVTDVSPPSTNVHVSDVPEQAPRQPSKAWPAPGCAVRITTSPGRKVAWHRLRRMGSAPAPVET